ncbi:MAG: DUF4383 domain-containing protein [Actinomycetota bacterium]
MSAVRARLLAAPAPLQGLILTRYSRLLAGAFTLLGLVGIFRTGFGHFSNVTGHHFLVFTVNPQTNLIHLIAGIVGIAMATTPLWARRYALLVGGLGVPWSIAGFILDGSLSDFFATNTAMNTAHLASTAVALALALWPAWPGGSPAGHAAESRA